MKRTIYSTLLLLVFMVQTGFINKTGEPGIPAVADGSKLKNGKYQVVISQSQVKWIGRKIGSYHEGSIELARGSLDILNNTITDGAFALEMSTIKDHDLKDKKDRAKLEKHLKSKDFFYVKNYPISLFNLYSITEKSDDKGNNYWIEGSLTIKGIRHAITFPAKIDFKGEEIVAQAKMTFDRSKYNVRFSSGSFFENLGDKLIYDNIEMEVNLKFHYDTTL